MKFKRMGQALTLVGLVSNTFAGYVIPELQRNQKKENSSSLGLIHQERKVIGTDLGYSETQLSEVSGGEDQNTTARGILFYSSDRFKAEGTYSKESTDFEGSGRRVLEAEVDNYDLKAGFKITDTIGIGAGFAQVEQEFEDLRDGYFDRTELQTIEIGPSLKLSNDIIIGAGIRRITEKNETYWSDGLFFRDPDLEYDTYFLGIGQTKLKSGSDGYAWEFAVVNREKERVEGDLFSGAEIGDKLTLIGSAIFAYGRNQFESVLNYSEEASYDEQLDIERIDLKLNYEYLFTSSLYGIGELGLASYESRFNGNSVENEAYSLTVGSGYRTKNFDVDVRVNYSELNAVTRSLDQETLAYTGNFSYFF